ncbi:hypothetical protein [Streptomyces sp. TS71-3]|uniref:hypothetical protein n=1 Tax=Streptomyces sp. TS71-3 TaxID=2733862 RepID=UPI001BB399EE|nr:hypothetical protein [Streptomyces sp. TS71-3]
MSLSSVALLATGAGVSQADDSGPKFVNTNDVLNCFSLSIADIPVLSSANTNQDCSKNVTQVEVSKKHDRH